MYLLVKFQFRILKALEVTALQSSSNRKIEGQDKISLNEKYSSRRDLVPKTLNPPYINVGRI